MQSQSRKSADSEGFVALIGLKHINPISRIAFVLPDSLSELKKMYPIELNSE
jgi:hypothetical protein